MIRAELLLPKKILFGAGVWERLGDVCAGLGARALLCAGRGALRRSGRLDQAEQMLAAHRIAVTRFEGVEAEPSLATCERGIRAAREQRCDLVVAVGGGSALDAGKTIAIVAPQRGELADYFHGGRRFEHAALPCVAVPTTAGTGTECTPNAVLSDPDRRVKKSLRDERMVPAAALVDPDLTLTLPPDITAQSGMDALTQAIESLVTQGANPITDALALRAVTLLADHLPGAVSDGSDRAHREGVALGSLLTAMAFGNAGLGAVHGLAHPLGIRFGIPHGLVCAVLLPVVCRFNLPARREKFGEIARAIGAPGADALPDALDALNACVGIPRTLWRYGIRESDFPGILKDCRSGSMAKNPRPATDDDLADILRHVV